MFLTIKEYRKLLPKVSVGLSGQGYWWAQLPDGSVLTGATELIVWDKARLECAKPDFPFLEAFSRGF